MIKIKLILNLETKCRLAVIFIKAYEIDFKFLQKAQKFNLIISID